MSETFKIHRWDSGEILASVEAETLKESLEKLVARDANLYRASLVGARLDGARLVGARLDGARLVGARLDRARLVGASLVGARLDGARLDRARLDRARLDRASLDRASLVGASLVGARLDRARLDRARLDRARLVGARLDGASLVGASLDRASLDFIKHDLWGILLHVPHEVDGILATLREGRVDGSVYEGDCACLVGTIANVRHCSYKSIPGIVPDYSRPAEVWFMGIAKGDTAEKNQIVKITIDWVEEFQKLMQATAA